MADPAAFVGNSNSKAIVKHGIVQSQADLTTDMVSVTRLTVVSRRLREAARRLAGSVSADFTVTVPASHSIATSSTGLTVGHFNTTKLIEAVHAKATSLGVTVNVTGVTVNSVIEVVPTTAPIDTTSGAWRGMSTRGALLAFMSAVVVTVMGA